jgi:transcription-repair coupling factor (superfamily II helicase)
LLFSDQRHLLLLSGGKQLTIVPMTATIPSPKNAERLHAWPRWLDQHAGFAESLAALQAKQPATFDGVWGSGCALVAARLLATAPSQLLIVFPTAPEMEAFEQDWPLFSPLPLALFPPYEGSPEEISLTDDAFGDRLVVLKQLLSGDSTAPHPRIVATCTAAMLQPSPSPEMLRTSSRTVQLGDTVEVVEWLPWLTARGYNSTTAVQLPGEYSFRGGILDIFPPDQPHPLRLELFDDALESLRTFDIVSQRSLEQLKSCEITAPPPPETSTRFLTDFLPQESWIVLVEPLRLHDEGTQYRRHVELPARIHDVPAVFRECARFATATFAPIATADGGAMCRVGIESIEKFSGEIGRVREELDHIGQQHEVFVVATTEAEQERLNELLGTSALATRGKLHYLVGELSAGFRLPGQQVAVVTSHELFHRGELRRTPRRHLGKAIDHFLDLREGDLVVHLSHGIGRYRGLKMIHKGEHIEEHLEIEFHGGTKIYVPGVKIGLVQKYIGGTKTMPTLAKIGGKSWVKQKAAAEAAVQDLAAEMLEIQAVRTARPGITFGPDTQWQHEFDASFPYTETPDQLTAIAALKADMRRSRPMDRLLCGDVGFGKTEVGMRAAFKAVDNGYQVAVLVPTTILAEQHYHTFLERMAEFPFDIAKLSRFCTPQEEKAAIAGLKSGRVDIVIGTHRLASQDVVFHNLGLVIIDEEQRFGVDVKERLKAFRATVDVLTMSATPIPRTLHMSLVGVRDISNLTTAPQDRNAVETKVIRWNDEQIRHAIHRELSRGGQIFFVHNRVNDIEALKQRLSNLVPEASIRIGHGQMPERELEQVMVDFIAHKYDLLLATTIVESGLDIPNANTIFIDEADRYGLADLHQLRGRVGRYKHRAHCYLLLDPNKHITPNASRRLRAIEEFSEMGSGFAISMRDLEIRGAGNLLGTQQSGHIAAVGYELYCQLLETAVRQLQKKPPKIALDVDIDLPGEAYLPDEYVPDMRLKIDLYRRMSRVESFDQVNELRQEMRDRFGELPGPVERLLVLTELKMDAAVWAIQGIYVEDKFIVFKYSSATRIEQLARQHKKQLRVVDTLSAYWPLPQPAPTADALLALVKKILRPI